jgi:hypothetical protein
MKNRTTLSVDVKRASLTAKFFVSVSLAADSYRASRNLLPVTRSVKDRGFGRCVYSTDQLPHHFALQQVADGSPGLIECVPLGPVLSAGIIRFNGQPFCAVNEVTLIDWFTLRERCLYLCAATILGRAWPCEEDVQVRAALSLAGGLYEAGMFEEEAYNLLYTVTELGQDCEDRGRCISNTWRRGALGDPLLSWKHLDDVLGYRVCELARSWIEEAVTL